MKIVDTFPTKNSKWNWDELLDGQIRGLVNGIDFHCKGNSVAQLAYKAAKLRGVKVRVRNQGTSVFIQRTETT